MLFVLLDFCWPGRKMKLDLLGELDRLRDSAQGGTTPRTCWIMPAEGSKSWNGSKPPVLSGIAGFFYLQRVLECGDVSPLSGGARRRARQIAGRPEGLKKAPSCRRTPKMRLSTLTALLVIVSASVFNFVLINKHKRLNGTRVHTDHSGKKLSK